MKLIGGTVLALVLLTGCGARGGEPAATSPSATVEDAETPPGPVSAPVQYDESELIDYLKLNRNYIYTSPDGVECEIAVVLTSASAVSLYADAGDNVASNSDRTAGVKIVGPQARTCHRVLTEKLAGFPPSG